MAAILGRFVKQPNEILDYDVDYGDWFSGRSDSVSSFSVTAEAGITVVSSSLFGYVVKVVLEGGTAGTTYKITVRLTTTNGLVKEADFKVQVKEV